MTRRLAALATLAALTIPAPADARSGCNTKRCHQRVLVKHKRAVVKPHRAWLAAIRGCEVRGQRRPYRTNTGNGHYGGYQFNLRSWAFVGGRGLPSDATQLEQDFRAVLLLRVQGPGAWPVCSRFA